MEMTLGQAFARSARKFSNKTACVDDEKRLTYGLMNSRVNRWAQAALGLGLGKGRHIATLANNCLPLMEVYLGNLKCGLVTVPLDARGKCLKSVMRPNLPTATSWSFTTIFRPR